MEYTDTERLRSIHENRLCDNWLEECDALECDWDTFLELVDEQVAMDNREKTPELQSEIMKALKECETGNVRMVTD